MPQPPSWRHCHHDRVALIEGCGGGGELGVPGIGQRVDIEATEDDRPALLVHDATPARPEPLEGAGGAVALLLALTVSWWLVLWTLLLFLGIHVLEGYVLAPRVQARFVHIHPYLAFLALLAGIEVGGLVRALFAVPVASMLAVFARAAVSEYRARKPERFVDDESPGVGERRRRLLEEFSLGGGEHPLRDPGRRLVRRALRLVGVRRMLRG